MKYSLSHIAKILDQEIFSEQEITEFAYDSRKIQRPEKAVFFAIVTDHGNGHEYISAAYSKGVRAFIVSEKGWPQKFPDAHFILAEKPLQALQTLARTHRKKYHIPVMAITGSNGKTIVKEWIWQLSKKDKNIVRSPGSFNSQLGVPLSVSLLESQHDIAIIEAGISKPGEMEELQKIIAPTIGVFTHLGTAHLGNFKNKAELLREKAKLFANVDTLIYNADDLEVDDYFSALDIANKISWGRTNVSSAIKITQEKENYAGTIFTLTQKNIDYNFWIPFQSKALVDDAIIAIISSVQLGLSYSELINKSKQLKPVNMRLQLTPGIHQSLLIQDYYNNDFHGFQVAIDFTKQHCGGRKQIFILSQPEANTDLKFDQNLTQILSVNPADKYLIVGEFPTNALPKSGTFECFESTEKLLQHLPAEPIQNRAILIKGARHLGFEKIAEFLIEKDHSSILEIDLSAVKSNLDFFKSKLKAKTKLMAMIKASAYGVGSETVAHLLEAANVDYLCVAYPDEGYQLRQAGIKLPIMVLNAPVDSFEKLYQYDLEPEIFNFSQKHVVLKNPSPHQPYPVHLKFDTGMSRHGFSMSDLDELYPLIRDEQSIEVISLFSHLAASESEQSDAFTQIQFDLFDQITSLFIHKTGIHPLTHILNSNGILRFPNQQKDMVRLGIGLYGLGQHDELACIFKWKARVIQVKNFPKGSAVGYGGGFILDRDTPIATINVGYADGLLRLAGNRRYSLKIQGQEAPILGNICMDLTMVDVSNIPKVKSGDEVIIFSDNKTIRALADSLHTIPYEVLTNINPRIPRIYLME